MEYEIHQLKSSRFCPYGYMGMKFVKKHGYSIKREDYNLVYEGEIEGAEGDSDGKILERLFVIFNTEPVKGFRGHSMSVSDVVILNGKAYYCDDVGFVEIEF